MTKKLRTWVRDDTGLAMVEGALLFPILITLMFGLYDLGHGLLVKQKLLSSAHTCADLIARHLRVSTPDIEQAIEGARLVMDPYPNDLLAVDIVSVEFRAQNIPAVLWRETQNMQPNLRLPALASGLGQEGEGVVAVTVRYDYRPTFSAVFTGPISMEETAFLRGRRAPVVERTL